MVTEKITLGGGCFWCIDSAFRMIKGVISVTSGYSGGKTVAPTYKDICTGETGHAEVVEIAFNPQEIDFESVLNVFFSLHDPTTLNRQGADVGTQYRSVIFYHSEEQKRLAVSIIERLNDSGIWPDPIVTEVAAVSQFYEAEAYHQDYFMENSSQRYCQLVIAPKLKKFQLNHRSLLSLD